MKSNLEIRAIQNEENEIIKGLEKIDKGMNLIYSNCTFDFKIGKELITDKKFDTFLYNEESDIMIMLSQNSFFTKDDIINYLEDNNKQYNEIVLKPNYENNESDYEREIISDIYFVKDKNSLEEALYDSLEKGIYKCLYYPLINSYFSFSYKSHYMGSREIEGRKFKGLIQLDDKIILIVNNTNVKDDNIFIKSILKILDKAGIKTQIIYDEEPDIYNEYKYLKKLKKLY